MSRSWSTERPQQSQLLDRPTAVAGPHGESHGTSIDVFLDDSEKASCKTADEHAFTSSWPTHSEAYHAEQNSKYQKQQQPFEFSAESMRETQGTSELQYEESAVLSNQPSKFASDFVPIGPISTYLGSPSGLSLLSELLTSLGLPRASPWPHLIVDPGLWNRPTVPALSIPPKKEVAAMLHIYHQLVYPLYPLFSSADLAKILDHIFLNNTVARRDVDSLILNSFVLIMAEVLVVLSREAPYLSEMARHFVVFTRSCLHDVIFQNKSISAVKLLLSTIIINQGIHLVDAIWYSSALALQMSVELGLHLAKADPASRQTLEELQNEEERRRVFWTAYSLDRGLCLLFGRPPAFIDNSFTCPYPLDVPETVLARFKIRRIQSRILLYCLGLEKHDRNPPFPQPEETELLHAVADWRQGAINSKEELIQGNNTDLLILRRGVRAKDAHAMEVSMQIVERSLELYKTEGLQIAMTEGTLVVHDLFMNIITMLYIMRFSPKSYISLTRATELVTIIRPVLGELALRWNTASESQQIVDSIMAELNQ